jgi:acyl-homoserine lactone acylase PvdQ
MVLLLAPQTASGNALYINPHTTFYFRPEIQMSEEGLNAYGVVTWGNFSYQGFNENCGWMHTY